MISQLRSHDPKSPAIVSSDDRRILNYAELLALMERNQPVLGAFPSPTLALLYCHNTVGCLGAYLSCLAAKLPVGLAEPNSRSFTSLVDNYHPSLVILPDEVEPPAGYTDASDLAGGGYRVHAHPQCTPYPRQLHPELSLLLTTSGSTTSSKLVRLSHDNLAANACSIAQYLGLGPGERSIQSLPLHYAYGLSLVNSHLFAGGTVVLTGHSFMRAEFWSDFDRYECTSFAGVPYMYELLHRLRMDPTSHPTLRTMTQAGGGLREALITDYHSAALGNGKRFFVMYGQTEATARISYVPPDRLGDKIGSVGIAVPDGSMGLEAVEESADLQQVLYSGPNVMLGYASAPKDLELGNVQQGTLRTGDLGRVDDEGYFFLMGRLRRIAKIFGRRINLAEVEDEVEQQFPCRAAAVDVGDKIHLAVECLDDLQLAAIRSHVARFLSLRPVAVGVHELDQLPRTASRKIDYQAVQSSISSPAISS